MVRIPGFHGRGQGSIPGWGTEVPQATRCGQVKKKSCTYTHLCTFVMIQRDITGKIGLPPTLFFFHEMH